MSAIFRAKGLRFFWFHSKRCPATTPTLRLEERSTCFATTPKSSLARCCLAMGPGDFVLQAAEKNCHPPECRGLNIPNAGPWQFANGGLALGTSEAFLRWCDACEAHPKYAPGMIDQHFMNMCLADGYDCGWKIDSETRTFFCLYGGYDELRFDHGRPVNSFSGTRPLLIHANGGWPTEKLFQMEAE